MEKTLKTLDFHDCNAYDHQTRQGGDLKYGAPTAKVTFPFDYMILRDYAIN